MLARIEIRVYGRVQGVAFRWYAQRQAQALNLGGWVRNRPDGSVEIVAEGERRDLETLAEWTARGPSHARVDRQEVSWREAAGNLAAFQITG